MDCSVWEVSATQILTHLFAFFSSSGADDRGFGGKTQRSADFGSSQTPRFTIDYHSNRVEPHPAPGPSEYAPELATSAVQRRVPVARVATGRGSAKVIEVPGPFGEHAHTHMPL